MSKAKKPSRSAATFEVPQLAPDEAINFAHEMFGVRRAVLLDRRDIR